MRIVFLFFLCVAILILTSIGWYFNLSRFEDQHSKSIRELRREKIDQIRTERNIDKLQRQAVDLVLGIDEFAAERERGITKGLSYLFLAMFLSVFAVILSFSEVASRGKPLMKKVDPK